MILKNTEINYKITNYYRIGKNDDTNNTLRPIQIILNTENEKQEPINNEYKLKNIKNISISYEYS